MTPRTRTEPRSTPLRSPDRTAGLLLCGAVLVVLLVAPNLVPGAFVPRLTVENPTAFVVNVELAGRGGSGWFALGTVGRESQGVFEEVPDPGATWLIRFSYAGVDGGRVELPRSALQEAGWQLAIPAEVGERLTEEGFVPSAR